MKIINAKPKKPKTLQEFKARWRDAIMCDRRITATAARVLYLYADRMTMEITAARWMDKGVVHIWGAQDELAELAKTSVETVRRAFRQAIKCGYLKLMQRGNQFGGSNRFKALIPGRSAPAQAKEHQSKLTYATGHR